MFLNCGAGEDSWEVPVHPKGNQSWIFIGRTGAEAEAPILWPPDVKNWLICKDPDAGKDWLWEEKRMTEDEMVGSHHQLPELAQTHVHRIGDAIQIFHPVVLFSSHLQSFPGSGSFLMSQFFTSGGQSIGASAWASILPDFPWDKLFWSPCSPRDS